MQKVVVVLLALLGAFSAQAAPTLRVVSAGPVGQTRTLAEANEVRVVFSEPMVTLGKVPQPVTAPFFTIEPSVQGTFRWSGTTTLIFTPAKPLPYATEFAVTVDRTAKSVAGNTLDQPYRWTFSTPTIRLESTQWYRKDNGGVVISLYFNQPVDAATIVPHLKLRTSGHVIELPPTPPSAAAKRAEAIANAASDGKPVLAFVATEWNQQRFPPAPQRVVIETKPGIRPDTWLEVVLDEKLAPAGRRAAGERQSYIIEIYPTFFVQGVDCVSQCDPENRNAINFRTGSGVRFDEARKAVTVTDVTDPKAPVVLKPKKAGATYDYPSWGYSLDELGYSVQPGRRYTVRVAPSLESEDGQTLGYEFEATIDNWHRSAFVSFGSGHGVWETDGGSILPFHVRNFTSIKQWLTPLSVDQLMPTLVRLRDSGFNVEPPSAPATRTLDLPRDKISSVGLDLAPAIGSDNRGLAWAAVQPGRAQSRSRVYDPRPVSTIVQATNLGISAKDSPQNTVILVTRLDDAAPVEGATVSIRDLQNRVVWSGTTDARGIAVAPNTDLRRSKEKKKTEEDYWRDSPWAALGNLHFIVVAEKDGDVAYLGSDWNEGIRPWDFGVEYNLREAEPQLRGKVFADRGVYKLGEEVHFKLVARADTPSGMQLLAPGSKVSVVVRDSHANEIDSREVTINDWSSAEWTWRVPSEAPLGGYSVLVKSTAHEGTIAGEVLVAAYRRPDFRVDTTLTADSALAGVRLSGVVNGRYLFGAPMSAKPVKWTYTKQQLHGVPPSITDRWSSDRYQFLGHDWDEPWPSTISISQDEATLDEQGMLRLPLDTTKDAGAPFEYRLEGVVTDVTRQQIAGRASYRVEAAPWYIGLRRGAFFADQTKGLDTEIVAAGLDGLAVPGVNVDLRLVRLQWTSVRQAEGDGFYGWQSERKEIEIERWSLVTKADPLPLHVALPEGGQYVLIARAEDGEGRSTTTRMDFYAVGDGYTAWRRHDHNRIDLVPEKTTYKPGETARIMIQSPWETATALLTTEREGVRTWEPFELTSTQQTITVPITERDIPNVYVSVLLVKGRTSQDPGRDGSDPGKPAFRLGYVELKVEDASKRLDVDVKANRDEFRPASKATIEVNVRDAAGKPSQSEVTLWAVDYGVLSLTGYTTPDVLETIYLDKALQVANGDSRQRIISRRVMTPKGASEGGGGGRDAGPGTLRKDFRVLAFWVGSLVTDRNGRARTEITLPESLTTYRIMAVAGDRASRFGHDSAEIRINKPLMLTPAWPRFLAVGDKAHFGAVVHNQLKNGGRATVSIESLDPQILEVKGSSTVDLKPGATNEVRFDAAAKTIGEARIRMRVQMGRETDAFEDVIPVRVLVSPETVAAYGEAKPEATETLEIPSGVVPDFGGLRVDLASTSLVGLAEGASYLIEYPYGCSEQRASRSLALMLTAELGEAFALPGVDAGKEKETVRASLLELTKYQCGDGGFAFWPGDCTSTSPYLTSWVVHVFQRAQKLGYAVDRGMLDRAYNYLEGRLSEPPPVNEGWRVAYNAWQAFTIKALAEGGRNVDSHFNRVYEYRDRMPVFALAFLADALHAKGGSGDARMTELQRRLMNAILPEGGQAHVEELGDPFLGWLWSSNARTTAIVLGSMVRRDADAEMSKRMVRWLMAARKNGRWDDTQENAWALASLVDYYRKYESETPDFAAKVALGDETLATGSFRGRSTEAQSHAFTMRQVLAKAPAGQRVPVVFTRDGVGTLHYMLRFRYAANVMRHEPLDHGFHIERSYALQGESDATSFEAGDLIEVTLRIRNTKERRYVALTDPLPAGTEAVESWFATTAQSLAEAQQQSMNNWSWAWWLRGGWDYVERHDDRVNVFATRLAEGDHTFIYLVRATTAGTFIAAPAHAEEMYEPEVFGRTATAVVEIQK